MRYSHCKPKETPMKTTTALFCLTLLAACGSAENKASSSTGSSSLPTLSDAYVEDCEGNSRRRYQVKDNQVLEEVTVHEGQDCNGREGVKILIRYSYQKGTSLGNDTYEVEATVHEATAFPLTAESAQGMNNIQACGATDWSQGQAKSLFGCTDGPISAGDKLYSLIRITDRELQFGEESPGRDGKTPGTRHTILDSKIARR